MPSLQCTCSHRIDYSAIPAKDEWLLISDTEYDAFSGQVDAEELYRAMRHALLCPRCRRLWVFWQGYANAPEEFVPAPTPPQPP